MYVRRTNNQPDLVVIRERESDNDGIKCLKGVVRQATSVDPKHRQTAEEIYQQLQNLVSHFASFPTSHDISLKITICHLNLFNQILLGHLGADENVDGVRKMTLLSMVKWKWFQWKNMERRKPSQKLCMC